MCCLRLTQIKELPSASKLTDLIELENMSVKPIDNYITNSVRLFEVNPSQTLFSISYKPPTQKTDTKVSFRTHNSHLSLNYKFTTNKSKDVSRLLSALGPRGVSITPGKIEKIAQSKKKNNKIKESSKKIKGKSIQDIVGLATLIVNTDVEKSDPAAKKTATEPKQKANAVQNNNGNSAASKKKKNKNKGKKKR